jgi:biopolymer transport protein TolQ
MMISLMPHLILAAFLQDEAAAPSPEVTHSSSALLDMLHNSGVTAEVVLLILLVASIFSWTIMLAKWSRFKRAQKQSVRFVRAFRKSGRLSEIATVAEQFRPSPLVTVFAEIHDEYQRQTGGRGLPRNPMALERAAQTASSEALTSMEQQMTWLATIAQLAPFVGLFGTVMGIIDAFHGLAGASSGGTLRTVAPGISEALITTAAGLVVAVPALVGYNQLTARLREVAARMDDFGRELLNAIENANLVPPTQAQQPGAAPLEEPRRRSY